MPEISSIEDLLKKTNSLASQTGPSSTEEQLEEKMSEIAVKERERETEHLAASRRVPYVNLKGFAISPEAISLIPRIQSEQLRTVAFLHIGEEIRLGAVEPDDQQVKELAFQLGERHKAHILIYKISEESLRLASKFYDALPIIKPIIKGVQITPEELKKYRANIKNFQDVQQLLNRVNITDVMSILTAAALEIDSSDIHIEAEETGIKVRFRIDGELQTVAEMPKDLWPQVIARIKLISGLKINITNKPQDGRMTIFLDEGKTDVRVSTLPTTWGESVVLRLLKPTSIRVGFAALGFRPAILNKLEREIRKPHGMILTTGPTGSGKTTTLYSILQLLNQPGVKIITIEDPVEYKIEGINQSQIDQSRHYSFADGLRSILRQDPDIVMVGEIRDLETGETAINAALTGHLMLSTVHTNDAAGAVPRLVAMGVRPFLLAPALNAIIGQRLVRRICQACRTEDIIDQSTRERVAKILSEIPEKSKEVQPEIANQQFYRGAGCKLCNNSGFKGRIGIYEVLIMNEELEKAVRTGTVSEYQMREIARNQGMVTMVQDGLLKTIDGITSVNEVFRVAAE